MNSVACIIPTYNGKNDVARLLDSIEDQTLSVDIFVVDSSSSDGTKELLESRACHLTVIPSAEFNHGGTRQLMVDKNPSYEFYVFMTQDAYLADEFALARLIKPFSDSKVGAVCGRQLPHKNAALLAEHARLFNYPPRSQIKSLENVAELGIKVPFMSNSFAAYRNIALIEVGGFPTEVILSEDMYVAGKMILNGWKIAYAGDACCFHSHNYSISEEVGRYFDIGVFHAREMWVRKNFGGAGGEGLRYIKSELKFLGIRRFFLWPGALIRNALKLIGYKLGQQEAKLPIDLNRKLSMHKSYWDKCCKNKKSSR